MSLVAREVFRQDFIIGPGSVADGTAETIYEFWTLDLSHSRELLLELVITGAVEDAGDALSVFFEDTTDRLKWHERARFPTVTGDMTPTTAAPLYRRMALQQLVNLAATEESYVPSGSVDGSDIPPGSVVEGPFPHIYREGGSRQPTWRYRLDIAGDVNQNALFTGTLRAFSITENGG